MTRNALALDPLRSTQQKLKNAGSTLLLLVAKVLVLGAVSWLLAGPAGIVWASVGIVAAWLFAPRFGAGIALRMNGARPLPRHAAPELWEMTRRLSVQAGLPALPRLHFIPSPAPNAFTVGTRHQAAIAVSDGLLRALTLRELQGVLAHEIAHIRNEDLRVMHVAGALGRVTRWLSIGGLLSLTLFSPLWWAGPGMSWLVGVFLLLAPLGVDLLQLALSRAREFDADLDAAALTGDPHGLAAALRKLEIVERGLLRMLVGMAPPSASPLLRSHPPTAARIERLLTLAPRSAVRNLRRFAVL